MEKTMLLFLPILAIGGIQAVDWSSLLGGEATTQQQTQPDSVAYARCILLYDEAPESLINNTADTL